MPQPSLKSIKVFAKHPLQVEAVNDQGKSEGLKASFVYLVVTVPAAIYTKEIVKLCNFVFWNEIPQKRAIIRWDLRKAKLIKFVRMSLSCGQDKKRIRLKVNKTDTTMEKIASGLLALKKMSIDGKEWKIDGLTIPGEKITITPPDEDPNPPSGTITSP